MTSRIRRRDHGHEQAGRIIRSTATEIRLSRRSSGVSIETAAKSVGMSPSTFGRIERAELRTVSVEQMATACAAVGLKFVGRAYPDGDPVRDAGQTRLLGRFRAELPQQVGWRSEVPIPIPGDRRAWDGVCRFGPTAVGVEAETRLLDIQALERRIALKRRDSNIDLVILVVASTAANRRSLSAHRDALRASFPLDSRAVLAAVRAARSPESSGIVIL